jgi:concanavalin A-like lectin/glucanase superfamily protein/predicted actin-binding protein
MSRALDVPDELELSRGRCRRRAWGGLQGRLRRTVGAALVLAWLASAGPASADTIFSDGFESGDFSAWSQTLTAGDGNATVQSANVRTGLLAAQLSESATSGSKAYSRKSFSAVQDLTASADFNVLQQGASGGNVPFFRFLDPTSARIVSLYRQNGTKGSIGLGYGGVNYSTTGTLALNTWATLSLHVITAGTSSTVQVRLNGALIYQTTAASLGTAGTATVQIGNDTAAQAFTIVADTISLNSGAASPPSPPVNASPPTISGTAQEGQTLTASNGTWTGAQPITYTYQWQRCDASGANCAAPPAPINSTSSTYAATSDDVGHTLRVAVTATNSAGAATATSAATPVVQPASSPPASTSPPTISGTATVGQNLTASPGQWSGTQPMTFAYQWRRCDSSGANCSDIAGATTATYVPGVGPPTDVGSTLRVVVTATNSTGSATATSAPTAVVQAGGNPPGLVALWHMDETSGTVAHDSIAGHDGILHSVQLGLAGFSGAAFGFNGSSSYISVPSANDLNPGAANIAITIRLKSTSVPATPDWDLIRKGLYTSSGGEYKMEYQPSGQASCGFNGSGGYSELMAGPAINDGQWHTVQCVKTSTAIQVVVDGQSFSKAANIGSTANADAVPIGARPGSEFFNGSLDEASIQVG